MHHWLAAWKGNLVNKACRVCLVKSVTTSMLVYPMKIKLLPKELCDGIDKITLQLWRKWCNKKVGHG